MHEFDDIPAALKEELRRVTHRSIGVPASIEAEILRDSRQAILKRFWRRRALRWAGAVATVAAAALVTIAIYVHAPDRRVALRDDLNRDGRVDVLDAFYLARRLDDPSKPATWDINGDGRIDQSDVDAIAQNAVRIGGSS